MIYTQEHVKIYSNLLSQPTKLLFISQQRLFRNIYFSITNYRHNKGGGGGVTNSPQHPLNNTILQ